jgi:hypothetical protein
MNDDNTSFHSLPRDAFPLIVHIIEHATGSEVERIDVSGPGALTIKRQPTPTDTYMEFDNGVWAYATHDGRHYADTQDR